MDPRGVGEGDGGGSRRSGGCGHNILYERRIIFLKKSNGYYPVFLLLVLFSLEFKPFVL